jgi:hypothetical protein
VPLGSYWNWHATQRAAYGVVASRAGSIGLPQSMRTPQRYWAARERLADLG